MQAVDTGTTFPEPSSQARQGLITVMLHMTGNPLGFDMSTWDGANESCGTAHCIAGWAATLWERNPGLFVETIKVNDDERGRHSAVAKQVLDLDMEQADRLFYTVSWPEPFRSAHRQLGTLLGEILMPYRDVDGDLPHPKELPSEVLNICHLIRKRMTNIALDRITNFMYGTYE